LIDAGRARQPPLAPVGCEAHSAADFDGFGAVCGNAVKIKRVALTRGSRCK